MKKPAGPRPLSPRHRTTLRKIRSVICPQGQQDSSRLEDRITALGRLLSLMEKNPGLSLKTGRPRFPDHRRWNPDNALMWELPSLILDPRYRPHLPANAFGQALRHLLRTGEEALFVVDEDADLGPEDLAVLESLGINLLDPARFPLLKSLLVADTFLPGLLPLVDRLDLLASVPNRQVGACRHNIAGAIFEQPVPGACLETVLSNVHPDRIEIAEVELSHWYGSDVDMYAGRLLFPPLPDGEVGGWSETHGTAFQHTLRNILSAIDEEVRIGALSGASFFITHGLDKVRRLVGHGADPLFRPEWSHYPEPMVLLQEGFGEFVGRRGLGEDDPRLAPLHEISRLVDIRLQETRLSTVLPGAAPAVAPARRI
jgi:hypothetical protein